jgi:maltose/moltooligosaccharide transporter
MNIKPQQSFWQIWNMCFGYFGIQFAFALQQANVSRIFQTLGARIEDLPMLSIAAPLTGLLVQPIVGYLSDRTWNRMGRRRPYFIAGAILSSFALIAMPNSTALWFAAGMLWILDASVNVSMEPLRALVADNLPVSQRSSGYAMQVFFISMGSVVANMLPWLLTRLGVSNASAGGAIPQTVRYSFYVGAMFLVITMLWTVITSREYPEEAMRRLGNTQMMSQLTVNRAKMRRGGLVWLGVGGTGLTLATVSHLGREFDLLTGGMIAYGACQLLVSVLHTRNMFTTILEDLHQMPDAMRRIAVVQFFSWFALFAMWTYMTPAVANIWFGAADPKSTQYNEGANWAGVLYSTAAVASVFAAAVIPLMVRRMGPRFTHLINVWLGGIGLLSFLTFSNAHWLILSMVGVGFACASIPLLPYALLSQHLPANKMGIYMGLFNCFIVIPQLIAATVLGSVLKVFFGNSPVYALAVGGLSLLIAGLAVLRVKDSSPLIGVSVAPLGR